jgi:predicted DNA-binding protein (UPF0251 family)
MLLFIACNNDNTVNNSDGDNTVVFNFLKQVKSFEAIDSKTPISYFEGLAQQSANEKMDLSEGNIQDILNAAKNYKHCVIIVEDHTIVKIVSLEDCKQSGSWGACMPIAEGYIKKGELDYHEDYINNIIGLPDSQKRTAYLFN